MEQLMKKILTSIAPAEAFLSEKQFIRLKTKLTERPKPPKSKFDGPYGEDRE